MTKSSLWERFCLVWLLFFWAYDGEGSPLLFVGDHNFAPFSFVDEQGVFTGIDIEMLREVEKRSELQFNLKPYSWNLVLAMTRKGQCDGSFPLLKQKRGKNLLLIFIHYILVHSEFLSVKRRDSASIR